MRPGGLRVPLGSCRRWLPVRKGSARPERTGRELRAANLPRVATTQRPADLRRHSGTLPHWEGARREGRGRAPIGHTAGGGASRPAPLLGSGGGRLVLAQGPGHAGPALPDRPRFLLGRRGSDYFLSLFASSNVQGKSRIWLESKWMADLGVRGRLGPHAAYAKQSLLPPSNLREEGLYVICTWAPRTWHTVSAQ